MKIAKTTTQQKRSSVINHLFKLMEESKCSFCHFDIDDEFIESVIFDEYGNVDGKISIGEHGVLKFHRI